VPGFKSIRLIIAVFLLVGLGFTSTAAYAYWTDVSNVSNVVIEFDPEDPNLIVEATHSEFTGKLVPIGFVYFEGEVDEVVFTYDVRIDKELVRSMNLVVDAIDISIGELEEYEHLVQIQINGGDRSHVNELYNSTVTITVIVRLLEPIDQQEAADRGLDTFNVEDSREAAQAIKGETISFTLRFSVQPRVLDEE
jgi:predicted ribosomally synthesized peptide with SipW-like signal peptide